MQVRKAGKFMRTAVTKKILRRFFATALVIASMILGCYLPSSAQENDRGTIKGTVTADQGDVHGFRVAAHNLDRGLYYTVFTAKGQYTVPQALPGRYEVMVYEPDYDSPKSPVQLGRGDTKTVDLAIKKRMQPGESSVSRLAGGDEGAPTRPSRSSAKIEYVNSLDEEFPPGPGLDLLKENCTGCHADSGNGAPAWNMHYDRAGFLLGIEKMTETGPGFNGYAIALGRTVITKSQKEMLADYMARNFGPAVPDKRLRIDPLVVDEQVASKMIYVSYEIPDLPFVSAGNIIGAPMVDGVIPQLAPPEKYHHLGSVFISPVDGNIYFSSRASNSILRLRPNELDSSERWTNYAIKGDPYTHPSGIAVDKQGRVYWAELKGAMLGELDPATGKQIRHALPEQAGAVHEVVVDKDGNVGFDLIWGAFFGRMEAVSRRIHMYPTPTPDNGMYGLAADQHGNLWGAGWQKGTISKWDVETESVKEYKVPNSWGQVRRISVDSKGIVWASEYISGMVARLDPVTGNLSEYKIPLSGAKPYEAWTDKLDNVWLADEVHSAMIKFDPKSGKFTFYPMPQPHQSINKIQVADDNTIWIPTRGEPICAGVHFYPNGYTADARPMP
jgi:virginiamycin B lyase